MKPTVGRIVLYVGINGQIEPGIVTMVHGESDTIEVTTFPAGQSPYPRRSVSHDDTKAVGTWHWMEYQKAVAAGQIPPAIHKGT